MDCVLIAVLFAGVFASASGYDFCVDVFLNHGSSTYEQCFDSKLTTLNKNNFDVGAILSQQNSISTNKFTKMPVFVELRKKTNESDTVPYIDRHGHLHHQQHNQQRSKRRNSRHQPQRSSRNRNAAVEVGISAQDVTRLTKWSLEQEDQKNSLLRQGLNAYLEHKKNTILNGIRDAGRQVQDWLKDSEKEIKDAIQHIKEKMPDAVSRMIPKVEIDDDSAIVAPQVQQVKIAWLDTINAPDTVPALTGRTIEPSIEGSGNTDTKSGDQSPQISNEEGAITAADGAGTEIPGTQSRDETSAESQETTAPGMIPASDDPKPAHTQRRHRRRIRRHHPLTNTALLVLDEEGLEEAESNPEEPSEETASDQSAEPETDPPLVTRASRRHRHKINHRQSKPMLIVLDDEEESTEESGESDINSENISEGSEAAETTAATGNKHGGHRRHHRIRHAEEEGELMLVMAKDFSSRTSGSKPKHQRHSQDQPDILISNCFDEEVEPVEPNETDDDQSFTTEKPSRQHHRHRRSKKDKTPLVEFEYCSHSVQLEDEKFPRQQSSDFESFEYAMAKRSRRISQYAEMRDTTYHHWKASPRLTISLTLDEETGDAEPQTESTNSDSSSVEEVPTTEAPSGSHRTHHHRRQSRRHARASEGNVDILVFEAEEATGAPPSHHHRTHHPQRHRSHSGEYELVGLVYEDQLTNREEEPKTTESPHGNRRHHQKHRRHRVKPIGLLYRNFPQLEEAEESAADSETVNPEPESLEQTTPTSKSHHHIRKHHRINRHVDLVYQDEVPVITAALPSLQIGAEKATMLFTLNPRDFSKKVDLLNLRANRNHNHARHRHRAATTEAPTTDAPGDGESVLVSGPETFQALIARPIEESGHGSSTNMIAIVVGSVVALAVVVMLVAALVSHKRKRRPQVRVSENTPLLRDEDGMIKIY
jgi:hypothetical protein